MSEGEAAAVAIQIAGGRTALPAVDVEAVRAALIAQGALV